MITFSNKIITSSAGKWLLPNRLFNISYGTSVNGTVTGPSRAHMNDTITVTAVGSTGYILDYITVDNVAISGNTFVMPYSDVTVRAYFKSKYNPLNLPPNTVRVRTNDGNVPYKSIGNLARYETATLVQGTSNVYDVYKSGSDFNRLLYGCNNVTEVLGANTAGITDMQFMFYQCSALTSVALFDTLSVTNMDSMFFKCSSLTTVPPFDTPNVTDTSDMFYYCTSLTTVPLFDTSSVTTMHSMFHSCSALTSVPLFNTSMVWDMASMLYHCSSLTSVPLFNTSSATDMANMLNSCSSLASIPLFNTSSVPNMSYMCQDCVNVTSGALALYQQASTHVTSSKHTATFRNCGSNTVTGAAELAQIPDSWK